MIQINVTNECGTPRSWFVEPYGDEVRLESQDDMLSIEFEHPADLIIDVTLHADGEVIWTHGADRYTVLVPDDLKLNDESVWPPMKRDDPEQ
ncbi:hypothetical protein [Nocardia sp. CA-120079]|uniref:hypothetical protein n=1 Tax=Nocardia sp. CA-120079 TaxID=3239974 RepID=UPI003D98E480